MFRVRDNPTFDIATGKFLHSDGESFIEEFPIRLDRDVQGKAKKDRQTAQDTASGYGSGAAQIGSSIIPGLERDANNPTGYDPTDLNNMLVSSQEAVGGSNAGVTGEANLAAARTRNAGGFGRVLDEAARIKGRQLSTNALNVQNENARLKQQKQQEARTGLEHLYGVDTSAQLGEGKLANEDLNTALEAGKSGWQQNAMGWMNTAANVAKAFKPESGGGGG